MRKSPVLSVFAFAFASISLYAQVHLGEVNLGSGSTVPVTVTIAGGGQLASLSVVTGGAQKMDFTDAGGTCKIGKTYQPNDTCTVLVRFAPTLAGTRMGGVSLLDGTSNSMAVVYLRGTGLAPQTGFEPALQVPVMSFLNNVSQLSVDGAGNVYIAEQQTSSPNPGAPALPGGIFKATRTGEDSYDAANIGSSLLDPVGVAVDGDGNVLEADELLNPVIAPELGTVSPTPGFFHEEQGLAVDAQGDIYSAGNGAVYKSSPAFAQDQSYSTVVGDLGYVHSIAVDGTGNVYVPDDGAVPAVYKETPNGSGYTQTLVAGGWSHPFGIAVDSNGVVYVNDSGNLYTATPLPSGKYAKAPLLSGQIPDAAPWGLAVDGSGNLYLSENAGSGPNGPSYTAYRFDRSSTPVQTFAQTSAGSVGSDGPRTITISNLGNSRLHIASIEYPADFREARNREGHCQSNSRLEAGENCAIVIEFAPVSCPGDGSSSEVLHEQVKIVTDTLNRHDTLQTIEVTGTVTFSPAATPVISRPSGTYSAGQTISLSDSTPGAAIYYTLDGKTPTDTTGIRYKGPETLEMSATLKVVAYAPGHTPSPVAEAVYRFVAAAPVISPAGGTYKGPVTVTITGATPGAGIFYTTAGNRPGASSKPYTGPFVVSGNELVMAIAAKTGFTTSSIVETSYKLTAVSN
jgi:hypothetical protein